MRRVIAVLLLLLLLAGCAGNAETPAYHEEPAVSETSSEPETDVPSPPRRIRLVWDSDDSLNPYLCETATNLALAPLLYQSVVRLNADYTVTNELAASVEYLGELTYQIDLADGSVFSNGANVIARDIVTSCSVARSAGNYSAQLANISDIWAVDGSTVRVSLLAEDANFVNLLTFPVLQYGTQKSDVPTGSGRYVAGGLDTEAPTLEASGTYYTETDPAFRTIELVNVDDKRTLLYGLRLGELDLVAADASEADLGNLGVSVLYDANRLVYLGCNNTGGAMSDYALRAAIAAALDRETLVSEAYSGRGTAVSTPFNPHAAQFAALESTYGEPDGAALAAYLAEAGYDTADGEGYLTRDGERFTLRLLVSGENLERLGCAEAIAAQLKALGIEVTVDAQIFTDMTAKLAQNDFDLYLAEVKLTDNLSLAPLFRYGSGAVYGIYDDAALLDAYLPVRAGTGNAADFVAAFESALPFVPLLYHDESLVFTRELANVLEPTHTDHFANIDAWYFLGDAPESTVSESSEVSEGA